MHLIGDIGGTNLRLALATPDGYEGLCSQTLADAGDLSTALAAYIDQAGVAVDSAALAVAAPCDGDRIGFTNADWSFSVQALERALGLRKLFVINDFVAQALALPALSAADLCPIGPRRKVITGPKVVLGPGTGLGVAGLVPGAHDWVPVATEGGHMSLAGANAREDAVIAAVRDCYGHCSAERLLSGPGLLLLYRTLAELDREPVRFDSPAAIAAAAATDTLAGQALALFFAWLGSVAGDLGLAYGAHGGVYLSGGILPRLTAALAASSFRERFTAKGRYRDYLDAIPCWLITAPHPALIGLSRMLD